ncbi:hypothetical protein CYMTET_24120 [Cymbomonas tetramitiformis]|uniref:Uncharacterized protein n=1 Tax=Cymbomonas tetramitiformis TaxID=36881 RepID=A0AAE0FWI2_9CHLO|nr:hypothetical protein CYMTET_24120 [Cymbomonas tetramitiformis]
MCSWLRVASPGFGRIRVSHAGGEEEMPARLFPRVRQGFHQAGQLVSRRGKQPRRKSGLAARSLPRSQGTVKEQAPRSPVAGRVTGKGHSGAEWGADSSEVSGGPSGKTVAGGPANGSLVAVGGTSSSGHVPPASASKLTFFFPSSLWVMRGWSAGAWSFDPKVARVDLGGMSGRPVSLYAQGFLRSRAHEVHPLPTSKAPARMNRQGLGRKMVIRGVSRCSVGQKSRVWLVAGPNPGCGVRETPVWQQPDWVGLPEVLTAPCFQEGVPKGGQEEVVQTKVELQLQGG